MGERCGAAWGLVAHGSSKADCDCEAAALLGFSQEGASRKGLISWTFVVFFGYFHILHYYQARKHNLPGS